MLTSDKPDITLAQILATLAAILGLVAAFGLSLTKDQQDSIVQVVTVGYPVFLIADAWLRGKRNENAAAQANHAAAQLTAAGADVPQTP